MLIPASGTGRAYYRAAKTIRFVRMGCTNRPFFHIVVTETSKDQYQPVIEQLGTYDPMINQYNEKLISLNYERIRHWIGNGAIVSKPVEQLFGLAGLFPIHPTTYMTAWRNRREAKNQEQSKAEENTKEAQTSAQ